MLILYIDNDISMQEQVRQALMENHRIETFENLYDGYKWIKSNEIPDIIITDFEMDQPTQLQSIKFLQSKAKLRHVKMIGYSDVVNADYLRLAITHRATRLFAKSELLPGLIEYVNKLTSAKPVQEEFVPENSTRSLGILTKRAAMRKK